MKRRFCLLLLCASVFRFAPPAFAADPLKILQSDLNRIFGDNRTADAQLGVEIYSLDREETIYEMNSSNLFMPASNNKIITAAVALICLGPDYRFRTQVLTDGSTADGVLKGDLIIVGFGDPFSSSRMPPKDPFLAFREWAAKLKQFGIRSIDGRIVGDGGSFEGKEYGRAWEWEDLTEGFAAPVSALQFNENLAGMDIKPGSTAGSPALITVAPLPNYLFVDNKVVTQAATKNNRIEVTHDRSMEAVTLSGTLQLQSSGIYRTVAVLFPIRYYLSALKQVLSEEGIDVSRCTTDESKGARTMTSSLLWTHASPPLSELLPPLMKMSLNLGMETLVRTLGLETRNEGTFAAGKEALEETLDRMGLKKESYSYADGSGLSRMNLVSPKAVIRVLKYMRQQESFAHFYDAFPIAGVDGTLAGRMKKTKAEGNARAKTGTFTNSSALSGYVKSMDGEMLAFSILMNNFLVSKDVAEKLQDSAVERLASFSRKNNGARKTIKTPAPGTE
jgi:D-alanyl-D-alanine carboxypeptidase/D-alanyl-D-alanine-endopeptidase (penicillin-binding protein 4)